MFIKNKFDKKISSFDECVIDALQFLIGCCNLQNSSSAFTFDGAIFLFEKLEILENWINEHKSPKIKLQEMKQKKKHK